MKKNRITNFYDGIKSINLEDKILVKHSFFANPKNHIVSIGDETTNNDKINLSSVRELIKLEEYALAIMLLEKRLSSNCDDMEALKLILKCIDSEKNPHQHSLYCLKLYNLKINDIDLLSCVLANDVILTKNNDTYSINVLKNSIKRILLNIEIITPDTVLKIVLNSFKYLPNNFSVCQKDIILASIREIGANDPAMASLMVYELDPDNLDSRGLKSAILFAKRSKKFLFALLLADKLEPSVWLSDQKSEIYMRMLKELSTDDPQQVENVLSLAKIPKKIVKKLALEYGEDKDLLYRQLFIHLKDSEGPLKNFALEAGKYHQRSTSDAKFLDILSNRLGRAKFSESALDAIEKATRLGPTEIRIERYLKMINNIDQLNEGVDRNALRNRLDETLKIIGESKWSKFFDFLIARNEQSSKVLEFNYDILLTKSRYFIKLLAKSLFDLGNINLAISTIERDADEKDERMLIFWKSLQFLDINGLDWPINTLKCKSLPKSSVYLLHNSAPFHSGGYATRSHGLMLGINKTAWNPRIISRLGYPNDLKNWKEKINHDHDLIENLNYFRLLTENEGYGNLPITEYLEAYCENLEQHLINSYFPEVIHGASNFMNGYVAVYAAKKYNLKSVYEVRGLWEITRASRQPSWANSQHFNLLANLEAEVAKNADAVICITQALADEMTRRGVDSDKITIVPNGVNIDNFPPLEPNNEIKSELGLEGKTIIGYVGSIVMYEGLELLVEAYSKLESSIRAQAALLFVGDGASLDSVKRSCDKFNLTKEEVVFTGRVPHEQVGNLYSIIDIAPIPRISLPVTEMVSPMKPFEAMSMEKLVIVSDVAALSEIVSEGVNGRIFKKDDSNDLCKILSESITDYKNRIKIGKSSRKWVIDNRNWDYISKIIPSIYNEITSSN